MSDELVAYVKELDDRVYIQSPVSLLTPDEQEVERLAFAADVKKLAPNPNILWMQGRYVEADKANSNGDQWTAGEIGLKQLTPMLMPITVMHDLRSAVGTIAEVKLQLPSQDTDVPRARLDTTLALWAHRFPQIAEEAKINAGQGTLMQSMECKSPSYECSACGKLYQVAPGRTDKELWCPHLKGEVDATGSKQEAARILRSVVFTGTGLIFGTRGARGAYSEAHVDVEALAEFHAKARADKSSPKPRRKARVMEIEDRDYQALLAEKSSTEAKVTKLEADLVAKDSQIEAAEAARVKAEGERDAEKARADKAEETARVASLRQERLEALGTGFTAKLSKLEATNKRVQAQAGELSDQDWSDRIAELEETLDVKRDATADAAEENDDGKGGKEGEGKGKDKPDESTAGLLFDRADAAAAELTASSGSGSGTESRAPSAEARQSVVGGLIRRKTTTGAGK